MPTARASQLLRPPLCAKHYFLTPCQFWRLYSAASRSNASRWKEAIPPIIAAVVIGGGSLSGGEGTIGIWKAFKEMVEWGYEKYVREHTLEVGWTPQYIRAHPDRVEHFLTIRMNNLPTLEDYLRHVVARQALGQVAVGFDFSAEGGVAQAVAALGGLDEAVSAARHAAAQLTQSVRRPSPMRYAAAPRPSARVARRRVG